MSTAVSAPASNLPLRCLIKHVSDWPQTTHDLNEMLVRLQELAFQGIPDARKALIDLLKSVHTPIQVQAFKALRIITEDPFYDPDETVIDAMLRFEENVDNSELIMNNGGPINWPVED